LRGRKWQETLAHRIGIFQIKFRIEAAKRGLSRFLEEIKITEMNWG